MHAMILPRVVSLENCEQPLQWVELPTPVPGPGEVLLRVSVCGVCHTELDEIEGRTAPPRLPVVLGHQVVGTIHCVGDGVDSPARGARVGVGWIYSSSGMSDENLCPEFRATGRDVNGGYAEYMIADARYAIPIPERFSDREAAPLLCAGAIGYRAVKLAGISDGDRLGLTGFGGSAHLVLQWVRHRYPRSPVYVFARDSRQREFARELGADWSGDTGDRPPAQLDAIIDTTPAWKPVIEALSNLRPGGRLVINAIRKEDRDQNELLRLNYERHLWMEREIKTVANITRADLVEFLPLAVEASVRPSVTVYPLRDANRALLELRRGPIRGAKVLEMG